MINLVENYFKAKQAIYDHVGFEEDWVSCPLSDQTDFYWNVDLDREEDQIIFSLSDITIRKYIAGINVLEYEEEELVYYACYLFKQHFYDKWIYRGEKFTLIFYGPSHRWNVLLWTVR